jgi:RHS repeat-associated protein
VSSQYAYNSRGDVLSITHFGGQGIQIPFTYSYDAAENRSLYATNAVAPQTVTNTFDAGGRLIQSGSNTYAYDANGNLSAVTDPTGTTNYVWDTRNRLQSISSSNGQTTSFLYDFGTSLISQTDFGPTLNLQQSFVLDRRNVAYLTRSNGDNLSILTGRGIDQHVAVVHANSTVEYALSDAMNSTAATVDQTGKLVSTFAYEPFGKTGATSTYPFQFSGRMPIRGPLYYHRARCYDSSTRRFISQDPISLFRGGSSYVYAANSPLNLSDPTGLQAGGLVCLPVSAPEAIEFVTEAGKIALPQALEHSGNEWLEIKGIKFELALCFGTGDALACGAAIYALLHAEEFPDSACDADPLDCGPEPICPVLPQPYNVCSPDVPERPLVTPLPEEIYY